MKKATFGIIKNFGFGFAYGAALYAVIMGGFKFAEWIFEKLEKHKKKKEDKEAGLSYEIYEHDEVNGI